MTDVYQNVASIYNRLFSRCLRQLREDIRTYIFHKKFSRVVDICCGTGEQLSLLEKPGMRLSGIDNSISMLEQARNSCNENTELHFLDAEQDVFSYGSFDCAIISLALHEKDTIQARSIFENTRNIIRENGVIIIADYNPVQLSFGGILLGRMIIPLIERCAGAKHYKNYTQWMLQGGLEGFLFRQCDNADIISRPLKSTLLCCSLTKIESTLQSRQNFGLLHQALSHNHLSQEITSHEIGQ